MKKSSSWVLLLLWLCLALNAQQVDIYQRPQQFERSRDYDALHYKLQYRFDEDKKIYWGENTITLQTLKDDFQECKLDAEAFTVTAVKMPDDTPLKFEQTDRHLIVSFPTKYAYHEKITFTVQFQGENQNRGLKFMPATPNNPSQINTYSWPEYAHFWFPCYDFPNDKITNELIATVKDTYQVLSNGRLVSVTEDPDNHTKTFYWSQDQPHSAYLIVMIAGPYEIIKDSLGDLPVNYWVYTKDVPNAMRSFQKTPKMIDFFNRTFGYPYPWDKYDQICVAGSGGGMEDTSATILGHGTIHDERAEQDFSSEGLVAHELAHQWWGDLVTERTWSHVWLSESFATYSEYLFSNYDKGEEEGAVNLLGKKNSYIREANTRYMRPLVFNHYEHPRHIMDSHAYPGGAVVLHMLRFVMGDKPFFRSLQHFLEKHAYDVADTHDLMTAIKEATGQNLDWFFEQCVFKPGHPIFDIGYSWDEALHKLKLQIKQVQDFSKGVPIFRLPVIIGITTPEGKIAKKIWIQGKDNEYTFDVPQKPQMVRFDEGNYLVKEWNFPKSQAELLFQLNQDDVIGRMWAAEQLARYSKDLTSRDALIKSAVQDPFWNVRVNALVSLSKLKDSELISFFKEKCLDEHSRVRTTALQILGGYQQTELVGFFMHRFQQDDSYRAQAMALFSIGESGGKAHIPFLQDAAQMKSPRNVIKRAADAAIKTLSEK